jgi:hypothetical protein
MTLLELTKILNENDIEIESLTRDEEYNATKIKLSGDSGVYLYDRGGWLVNGKRQEILRNLLLRHDKNEKVKRVIVKGVKRKNDVYKRFAEIYVNVKQNLFEMKQLLNDLR